jgi:hypothetical protein
MQRKETTSYHYNNQKKKLSSPLQPEQPHPSRTIALCQVFEKPSSFQSILTTTTTPPKKNANPNSNFAGRSMELEKKFFLCD